MGRHVAFLRAVNVPGHARLTMDALRHTFASAGCRDLRTFGHSGNVVFESPVRTEAALQRRLTTALRVRHGVAQDVVLRTVEELTALLRESPFAGSAAPAGTKRYVALLARRPRGRISFPLEAPDEALEAIGMRHRDVFVVSRPKTSGFYGMPTPFIERTLGVPATSRNWSTLTKLAALAAMPAPRGPHTS